MLHHLFLIQYNYKKQTNQYLQHYLVLLSKLNTSLLNLWQKHNKVLNWQTKAIKKQSSTPLKQRDKKFKQRSIDYIMGL